LVICLRCLIPKYNAQTEPDDSIRNSPGTKENVTALLTARQDETRYRQVVNNVAIDVHNTQIVLEQARVTCRRLQRHAISISKPDAEQKKISAGAFDAGSTSFPDQNTLASAASAEVRARINLAEGQR